MLLRDLTDISSWIKRIIFRLDRLEGGAMLENASVTNGRLRFIGGLLRIDSGGTLTVIGHLNGAGDLVWDGPWALKGLGEITGDVSITGDLELLDDGSFTAAGIRIADGKIYVGTGANQIVIDGATGEITAGDMVITPSGGGAVEFPGGARLAVGLTGGASSIGLIPTGGVVDVSANQAFAWMRALGATISVSASTALIDAAVVRMPLLPQAPPELTTVPVVMDPATGRLYSG